MKSGWPNSTDQDFWRGHLREWRSKFPPRENYAEKEGHPQEGMIIWEWKMWSENFFFTFFIQGHPCLVWRQEEPVLTAIQHQIPILAESPECQTDSTGGNTKSKSSDWKINLLNIPVQNLMWPSLCCITKGGKASAHLSFSCKFIISFHPH